MALLDGPALAPILTPRPEVSRAARWRMKLSKAVELFLQEVRVTRAKQTAAGYESDLNRLIALSGMNTVLAFTPDLVRLYFTTESQRGNGMSTLHRKLATLREFSKWGLRHKVWNEDPTRHFPNIRRPKTLPRPFSDDEVARLLALELSALERVIQVLLLTTGLRATPLSGLRVGDVVSGPPPHLRVISKGAKPHTVELPPDTYELVRSYILAETDLRPQTALFPKRRGRVPHPIGRRELETMTHAWGAAADVADCLPHRFRHTYATGLLRGGADIRVVQELLAHEDIKSTMLYTEVAPPDRAKAVLRLPWKIGPST